MSFPIPGDTAQLTRLQQLGRQRAVAQARKAPFFAGKLDHIDIDRLDDPDVWREIPILDKDMLRAIPEDRFLSEFCVAPRSEIREYWRSGGATGRPLFYPRTFEDITAAMVSFRRSYDIIGLGEGDQAHVSFPLGIHPAGQMWARAGGDAGVGVNWAGAGAGTPTHLQLQLLQLLQPNVWMGMPSYGLHLANLADADGIDLSAGSVTTILTSAEPLSEAKREKLSRQWGARVFDSFGMTECCLMGVEDGFQPGFRIWTDMVYIEVLDPTTFAPVLDGEPGTLVATPLLTNHATPFLRWNSGDVVIRHPAAPDPQAPFSIFPRLEHARRTLGFFKISGVNINHTEFEDFMFRQDAIADFKAEAVNSGGLDRLKLSVEWSGDTSEAAALDPLKQACRNAFELTPEIRVLARGTLGREFEQSVKAPRFVDRRNEKA